MKNISLFSLALTLFSLFSAWESFAHERPDTTNLAQIVVTGTRSNHYIKSAPVLTEVLTSKSIKNRGAVNIFQALEFIPGVRVENQCQSCNFTMVRIQGLGAEHTQVLINGMPLYSGLAGVYGLQQISTVEIDKIEIVKGAGSALYGSGAVAGAINIITREPSVTPEVKAGVQFGSYGTNKYDISASMRNERGNRGLTVFAQRYTEGVIDQTGEGSNRGEVKSRDGVSDRVSTNLTNAGFGIYFDDAFVKGDKLNIQARSIFEKREGGVLTDDLYRNPFTEGTENIITERYESSLSYILKIGQQASVNLSLAFVNHNRAATNDSFFTDYTKTNHTPIDVNLLRPYLVVENMLTSTLSFNYAFKKHNLIIGAQSLYDKLTESGMYVVVDERSSYYGEPYKSVSYKRAGEFGLFIQDEWTISGRLVIVPGVRADFHSSQEEYRAEQRVWDRDLFPTASFERTSINPRVALRYTATDKITLRASVGTGFRAPYGFSEELHLCSGSPRVWKSSNLNPEKSVSYNLSADYFTKRVRVTANIFRTDLKDKIGFTAADEEILAYGYDYQWKNIDDAFVQGVELSAVVTFTPELNVGADFTLNQGRYSNIRDDWKETQFAEMSRYVSRFPSTTANLKLNYSPPLWNLSLIAGYQGQMYIDNVSKIKKTTPFTLVNGRVSREIAPIADGKFEISIGVNNLFNYIQPERRLDDAAFIYAPIFGRITYAATTFSL